MKKKSLNLVLSAVVFVCLLSSCNKDNNNSASQVIGNVALISSNMQNSAGAFSSIFHIEGKFPDAMGVKTLSVNGVSINRESSGLYYKSSTIDTSLNKMYTSFFGNTSTFNINGNAVKAKLNSPTPLVVDVKQLSSWTINKITGLTLRWTGGFSNSSATSTNPSKVHVMGGSPATDSYIGATVFAIVPSNLQTTTGTSQYVILDSTSSFITITPAMLGSYSSGESLDFYIGTGEQVSDAINGQPLNLLSVNITYLPQVTVQ